MKGTVLITGANRGIGLGLVRHYLAVGWMVDAAARDPESVDVFSALKDEYPDQLAFVQLDVADEVSISRLAAHTCGREFDLIINNAGLANDKNMGSWSADNFERHFRINASGPMLVLQALEPSIKEGAKIINMSSEMGSIDLNMNAEAGGDAYAASKAALNMLTRRLAEKVRSKNITVVAMNPGWVQTEMGGPDAPVSVEDAVKVITAAIEGLSMKQTGRFLSENGSPLPW